jgi:hypothetical protein
MKSLGPSNDDIPAEEMALAELLQSALSRGLGWCGGTFFKFRDGTFCSSVDREEAELCCASGAYGFAGASLYPSSSANDDPDYDEVTNDAPVQLGHAFRSAMTDD